MTTRTHPQYTPNQVLERCACITLDDLLERGTHPHNPIFKSLASATYSAKAHDCAAFLLEWPCGVLVLVVSQKNREFSQLSAQIIQAAYQHSANNLGLIFREIGGAYAAI